MCKGLQGAGIPDITYIRTVAEKIGRNLLEVIL